MNKKFLVLLALACLAPVTVGAATFGGGENYRLGSGQTVSDNLYVLGSSLDVAGNVEGDVFAGGGSVLVSGSVAGDVAAAGGNINLNSQVAGDIRVAGGNITISKSAGGDLVVAGGQVNVMPDFFGGKDVGIAGGSVDFSGSAEKSVEIKGGTVFINGQVGGNLVVWANEITLGQNAVIAGDFTYSSPKPAIMEPGAKINGQTKHNKTILPEKTGATAPKRLLFGFITVAWIIKTLVFATAALILAYFFRQPTKAILERAESNFWKECLRGFIVLIVLPIATMLSFFTVLGLFAGLVALVFYVAFLMLAGVFGLLVFARLCLKFVFKKPDYQLNWWVVIVAAFAFGMLAMVPFVGWIFGFVIFLASLGSVSATAYNRLRA